MHIIRLAIDVQSGDYGPEVIIAGVLEAQHLRENPFSAYLCGDEPEIRRILKDHDAENGIGHTIFIEHCSQCIFPEERKSRVWKTHTDASIVRCIQLQKEGVVDGSVSAGDSGILLGAALFILGRSEGVLRPALGAVLPTAQQVRSVLILDVGANLNCREEQLFSFGMMGFEYMRRNYDITAPKVALLNIGKEVSKGTQIIRGASEMLKNECPSYQGFVEGSDVLSGCVDVVVCDGFAGNVLLKACESFHTLTASILKDHRELIDEIRKYMTMLNPENYGAAPFLGIRGTVLKAHGWSSSRAIASAILAALYAASHNVK